MSTLQFNTNIDTISSAAAIVVETTSFPVLHSTNIIGRIIKREIHRGQISGKKICCELIKKIYKKKIRK